MTRILYLQGSGERAGAETMLGNLLRYLDRTRIDPTVAFLAEGPFVDQVATLDVPVLKLPVARLRQLWGARHAVRSIRRAAVQTQADVIHANGEKMAILAGLAARTLAIPSIAWLHDAPGAGGPAGWMAQRALRIFRCDAVVTCSSWMAHAFNRRLELGAVPIMNGLDLDALPAPNESVEEIKQQQGWPASSTVVVHATRLQRWKGTEIFLQAAARLLHSNPNLRYLVVGGALYGRELGYASSLKQMASTLGLDGSLVLTGFREDALEIMASSDIVVHCSLRPDPFPTVVLEGMALEKPVVATRTRGPEEAIDEGKTGILVAPGDIGEMAEAIARLGESVDLRSSIGMAAKAVARDRFSAARMAKEFESLYRRLLAVRPTPSAG